MASTADAEYEEMSIEHRRQLEGERLAAFQEDLSEWIADVTGHTITPSTFWTDVENGSLLCRLACKLHSAEVKWRAVRLGETDAADLRGRMKGLAPRRARADAEPGSFFARDNLARFLRWCVGMGVPPATLFEPGHLADAERRSDKVVLYSLMEIARHCRTAAPMLVRLERQIEREMAAPASPPLSAPPETRAFDSEEEADCSPPPPVVAVATEAALAARSPSQAPPAAPRRAATRLRERKTTVDELTRLVEELSARYGIRLIRVKKGQYKLGNAASSVKPLFIRLLRHHVVVRVGGGWDTLEHYLATHARAGAQLSQAFGAGRRGGAKAHRAVTRMIRTHTGGDDMKSADPRRDALGLAPPGVTVTTLPTVVTRTVATRRPTRRDKARAAGAKGKAGAKRAPPPPFGSGPVKVRPLGRGTLRPAGAPAEAAPSRASALLAERRTSSSGASSVRSGDVDDELVSRGLRARASLRRLGLLTPDVSPVLARKGVVAKRPASATSTTSLASATSSSVSSSSAPAVRAPRAKSVAGATRGCAMRRCQGRKGCQCEVSRRGPWQALSPVSPPVSDTAAEPASASTSRADGLRSASPASSAESSLDGSVYMWYVLVDKATGAVVGDEDCVVVDAGATVADVKAAVRFDRALSCGADDIVVEVSGKRLSPLSPVRPRSGKDSGHVHVVVAPLAASRR